MTPEERAAWLEERRKSIGGSDAPKIVLGEAYLVYLDKLGQLPAFDNDQMKWGRMLEDVVATAYAETEGCEVLAPPAAITRRDDYPWMHASLDRIGIRPDGKRVNVQCKTTGWTEGWGEPYTDEIPDSINLQVQHEMFVGNFDETDVPVLIRGSEFRVYRVRRSEAIIDKIIEIERDFWHHVKNELPPRVDWEHPKTVDVLKNLYGLVPGKHIDLGLRGDDCLADWEMWKERANVAGQEVDRYRGQIEHMMEGAETAVTNGGMFIKRKHVNVKEHLVKASQYIRLSVRQYKKHPEGYVNG